MHKILCGHITNYNISLQDSGQKRIGAISCTTCGMFYAASIPEDEAQHFKFHKHFISAVKYVVRY